jgi:hypothetical protein
MPTVINRHHYTRKPLPLPNLYVGRPTPLGNPFRLEKDDGPTVRARVLELYEDWLREALGFGREPQLKQWRNIRRDTHLVCSCAPLPCHADVIARVWMELSDLFGGSP